MIHPTDRAMELQRDYVCARCWHPLIAVAVQSDPNRSEVKCTNSNCNGEGYARKDGVERRRSDALSELWEARDNLKAIIPGEHAGKTEEQLLSELGF